MGCHARCAFYVASLVAIVLFQVTVAVSQEPMESRGKDLIGHVAVIDMHKILRNYEPFNEQIRLLSKKQSVSLKEIAELVNESIVIADEYRAATEDSPEFQVLRDRSIEHEQRIAAAQKKLRAESDAEVRRIHTMLFKRIQIEVEKFAKEHNIGLVLNYQPADLNPQSVGDARQLFNQRIVYHRSLDITNDILDQMDKADAQAFPVDLTWSNAGVRP